MGEKSGNQITTSSGNVFKDAGYKNPELMLLKAKIAIEIAEIIQVRKLRQVDAGKLMGIDQPRVSKLIRGYVEEYSLEKLLEFARSLGANVCIAIQKAQPRKAVRRETSSNWKPKRGHFVFSETVFQDNRPRA